MVPQLPYLGHVISHHGIWPGEDKVQAIRGAPAAKGVHQLNLFLGLLNFYAKFLPNLSTTVAPLCLLLQKRQPWCWGLAQQRAFLLAKSQLTSSPYWCITQPIRSCCWPVMLLLTASVQCCPTLDVMGVRSQLLMFHIH